MAEFIFRVLIRRRSRRRGPRFYGGLLLGVLLVIGGIAWVVTEGVKYWYLTVLVLGLLSWGAYVFGQKALADEEQRLAAWERRLAAERAERAAGWERVLAEGRATERERHLAEERAAERERHLAEERAAERERVMKIIHHRASLASPPPPLSLPKRISQKWVAENVPYLHPGQVPVLMKELRASGWKQERIEQCVLPHLPAGR